MSIFPLTQFEADLEADRKQRAQQQAELEAKTIVVRYGSMRMIAEYKYSGDALLGCGSKLVVRTHRGSEIATLLTTTCPNAGCGSAVTRKDMLDYIEASGGKDYPFSTDGRVLRVASVEDMNKQSALTAKRHEHRKLVQSLADNHELDMHITEVEQILGGERTTVFFTAPDRVDFRELVKELAKEFSSRMDMRQVGARDESRLIADYEKCGQHCCCKQFLKVLKPVSIRSAKQQKATLDPVKISGRCGRLMCCLRYEDQSYNELIKKLPKIKKRVGTPDGIGIVVERQVLTQIVLVKLEDTFKRVAFPVEDIVSPEEVETVLGKYDQPVEPAPLLEKEPATDKPSSKKRRRSRKPRSEKQDAAPRGESQQPTTQEGDTSAPPKKKRRRRRSKRPTDGAQPPRDQRPADAGNQPQPDGAGNKKKRRRRRRRKPGGGGGDGGGSGGGGDSGGGGGGG